MTEQKKPPVFGVIRQRIFGIPVDRKILFSNPKNIYKKKIEKRQRKLIVKISFIKPFIKENERVLLITTGYSPISTIEKYLIGWLFIYLKRSLFIFTNKRIFHIPTTPIYSYRNSIAQILYSQCNSIYMKGKSLVVRYAKHGSKDKFIGIAGKEKNKIKQLLKTIRWEPIEGDTSTRTHLCPRCTNELPADSYICESCKLKFKTNAVAVIISILFPGGGYFFTRQYFLGIIAALTEAILAIYLVISWLNTLNGDKNGIFSLIIYAFAILFVKAISILHSLDFIKEFIPKKKNPFLKHTDRNPNLTSQ
ncbi:MAG: hypothetical protein SWH54_15655 [Thermodesulfobacteriota bacterium]|nr:hypothetical protein [Thermodesulfobacteriota bacterium]